MKTVCIMDSVSRANGGIFEAERKLQQNLRLSMGVDVEVVGLRDEYSDADLEAWAPLVPRIISVTGPRSFGYAPALTKLIEDTHADLGYLVGLWKYPSVAAQRWSMQMGKPLMIAPHGMLDSWALRNSGFKKKVAGWLFQDAQLQSARCLRALCSAEAASIRAYGLQNPICVIPNGIDLPEATDDNQHRPFPEGKKVLLYLGRLHPKKGLANLVTAWSKVAAKDWLLAIAGWDQNGHEAELKKQVADFGIDSIVFLGPQFGGDKEACYRSCDASILPSFSEGLPMVVLEAWAWAKPVLMTPACNLPEGFSSDAALRIESSVEGIEAGLTQLFGLSREDLGNMGARGRKLAASHFAWRKLAADMASVYEWMLGGGPKPSCVEHG